LSTERRPETGLLRSVGSAADALIGAVVCDHAVGQRRCQGKLGVEQVGGVEAPPSVVMPGLAVTVLSVRVLLTRVSCPGPSELNTPPPSVKPET